MELFLKLFCVVSSLCYIVAKAQPTEGTEVSVGREPLISTTARIQTFTDEITLASVNTDKNLIHTKDVSNRRSLMNNEEILITNKNSGEKDKVVVNIPITVTKKMQDLLKGIVVFARDTFDGIAKSMEQMTTPNKSNQQLEIDEAISETPSETLAERIIFDDTITEKSKRSTDNSDQDRTHLVTTEKFISPEAPEAISTNGTKNSSSEVDSLEQRMIPVDKNNEVNETSTITSNLTKELISENDAKPDVENKTNNPIKDGVEKLQNRNFHSENVMENVTTITDNPIEHVTGESQFNEVGNNKNILNVSNTEGTIPEKEQPKNHTDFLNRGNRALGNSMKSDNNKSEAQTNGSITDTVNRKREATIEDKSQDMSEKKEKQLVKMESADDLKTGGVDLRSLPSTDMAQSKAIEKEVVPDTPKETIIGEDTVLEKGSRSLDTDLKKVQEGLSAKEMFKRNTGVPANDEEPTSSTWILDDEEEKQNSSSPGFFGSFFRSIVSNVFGEAAADQYISSPGRKASRALPNNENKSGGGGRRFLVNLAHQVIKAVDDEFELGSFDDGTVSTNNNGKVNQYSKPQVSEIIESQKQGAMKEAYNQGASQAVLEAYRQARTQKEIEKLREEVRSYRQDPRLKLLQKQARDRATEESLDKKENDRLKEIQEYELALKKLKLQQAAKLLKAREDRNQQENEKKPVMIQEIHISEDLFSKKLRVQDSVRPTTVKNEDEDYNYISYNPPSKSEKPKRCKAKRNN